MASSPKLCKDCANYQANIASTVASNLDTCNRSSKPGGPQSLVTGVNLPTESDLCRTSRASLDPNCCGPDARFFK